MTREDADRLQAWIATLTPLQCALLWRWITLAIFEKCIPQRNDTHA